MTGIAQPQIPAERERFVKHVSRLVNDQKAAELYQLISLIAVLRYEKVENSGTLLLCAPDSELPKMTLKLHQPFELQDARGVRKYLQITDGDLCLVSDCQSAYGFARCDQLSAESLTVRFRPTGVWELREGNGLLLRVEAAGDGAAPRTIDFERFAMELRSTFAGILDEQVERLCTLVAAAAQQSRGTNVLISSCAAAEASRLKPQCTLVGPVAFSEALIQHFTSIDGTVIIDTDGVCLAIGAILDGEVSPRGDRTRGGRYNSAVMYLDTTSIPSVIVVVSHDGTVDIVSSSGTHLRA